VIVKEDLEEAKERMVAWWDHEIIDRPTISYAIPQSGDNGKALLALSGFDFYLGKHFDGIDVTLDRVENMSDGLIFGGENIPTFFPNYGAGVMAAIFGIEPEYKSGTVWFYKKTDVKDIVSVLEDIKLNNNNEWYVRLKRITEIAAKRGAKGNYSVAMTDLGGVLDILVSFLGPTQVIVAMKRNPEIIDTCRAIILEKYLKVYDELQNIINKHVDGCNTWLNVWCPKRYYTMQCDLSVMLNPEYFKRFALPDLIEQAEHMDYSLYHMDGPEQIKFADDILPHVTGIQFVPGSKPGMPQDGADEWMPLYKKIQKAGKNIQMISLEPNLTAPLYKKLDPKGLFVYAIFISKSIANCYLPKFIGGDGGELVEKVGNWIKESDIAKITKGLLREYLAQNNLEIEKDLFIQVFKEVKKKSQRIGILRS